MSPVGPGWRPASGPGWAPLSTGPEQVFRDYLQSLYPGWSVAVMIQMYLYLQYFMLRILMFLPEWLLVFVFFCELRAQWSYSRLSKLSLVVMVAYPSCVKLNSGPWMMKHDSFTWTLAKLEHSDTVRVVLILTSEAHVRVACSWSQVSYIQQALCTRWPWEIHLVQTH